MAHGTRPQGRVWMCAQMVRHFGGTRDEWMERDMAGWLSSNRIYEGLPPILRKLMGEAEVYIVTTKQASLPSQLPLHPTALGTSDASTLQRGNGKER